MEKISDSQIKEVVRSLENLPAEWFTGHEWQDIQGTIEALKSVLHYTLFE